jgi:hypothetical protein
MRCVVLIVAACRPAGRHAFSTARPAPNHLRQHAGSAPLARLRRAAGWRTSEPASPTVPPAATDDEQHDDNDKECCRVHCCLPSVIKANRHSTYTPERNGRRPADCGVCRLLGKQVRSGRRYCEIPATTPSLSTGRRLSASATRSWRRDPRSPTALGIEARGRQNRRDGVAKKAAPPTAAPAVLWSNEGRALLSRHMGAFIALQ